VSDFGFARSGPSDTEKTHISTKVKGTAGYLDPEYLRTYQLTPKSDVFSFGILLVEILSARRPVELKRTPEERITIRWVCVSNFFCFMYQHNLYTRCQIDLKWDTSIKLLSVYNSSVEGLCFFDIVNIKDHSFSCDSAMELG
jgi:serine/threonine protein kinase